MYYSISTSLIYEFFKPEYDCPLCEIRRKTETNLADQFLGEAVMVDEMRSKVNKYGFCEKHFDLLYAGQSKLGLALQCVTRLNGIINSLNDVSDAKKAVKQAENIKKITNGCVICNLIEYNMSRYYETVARLYNDEENFRQLFKNIKGFCLNDYIRLLQVSAKAGKYQKEFLNDLNTIEKRNLNEIKNQLQEFCDHHDYKMRSIPLGECRESLPKVRTKFYGEKPVVPPRR